MLYEIILCNLEVYFPALQYIWCLTSACGTKQLNKYFNTWLTFNYLLEVLRTGNLKLAVHSSIGEVNNKDTYTVDWTN